MTDHNYTAQEALNLLMRKIQHRDPELAMEIQQSIDAGKDVEEKEPIKGRRRKQRTYRKAIRYSDEEALKIALRALRSCFIEQPMFLNSALSSFKEAATQVAHGSPASGEPSYSPSTGLHDDKLVEVEIQTETQISQVSDQTQRLETVSDLLVDDQTRNFSTLEQLTNFDGK